MNGPAERVTVNGCSVYMVMTPRNEQALMTERQTSFSRPPPPQPGGAILQVNFRLTVFAISDVNTRDLTAMVKFGVVMYWTDTRMVGFDEPLLPKDLWGPDLYLRNAKGGVRKEYEQFAITDTEEGRLKRIINFESIIDMPMNLGNFPYDLQVVRPELVCISHWSQCSGYRHGSSPKGQVYALHPVARPDEGKLMWLMNVGGQQGHIAEWILHSWSVKSRAATHRAGFVMTLLCLELHISRKYTFYHEKVIAPLLFLTLGAFFMQLVPPEAIEDRMNATFTLLVAAMTLLNTISDTLPKIDFLTVVDKAIYLTLTTLLWLGFESWVVYTISWIRDPLLARQVDVVLGLGMPLLYLLAMLGLFWPRKKQRQDQLSKLRDLHQNECIQAKPVEGILANVDVDAGGPADANDSVSRTDELATFRHGAVPPKVAPARTERRNLARVTSTLGIF